MGWISLSSAAGRRFNPLLQDYGESPLIWWCLRHMQALPSCQGLGTTGCPLRHPESFHTSMAQLSPPGLRAQAHISRCFTSKGPDLLLWGQAAASSSHGCTGRNTPGERGEGKGKPALAPSPILELAGCCRVRGKHHTGHIEGPSPASAGRGDGRRAGLGWEIPLGRSPQGRAAVPGAEGSAAAPRGRTRRLSHLHRHHDASCEQQSERATASRHQTRPCTRPARGVTAGSGQHGAGPAPAPLRARTPPRCAPHPCSGPQSRKQEIHPERKRGAGGLLAPSGRRDLPPAVPEPALAHRRQPNPPLPPAPAPLPRPASPRRAPQCPSISRCLPRLNAFTPRPCSPLGSGRGREKPLLAGSPLCWRAPGWLPRGCSARRGCERRRQSSPRC